MTDQPEFDIAPLLAVHPGWRTVYFAACARAEQALAEGDTVMLSYARRTATVALGRVGEMSSPTVERFLRQVAEAALREWGEGFELPDPLPPAKPAPRQ